MTPAAILLFLKKSKQLNIIKSKLVLVYNRPVRHEVFLMVTVNTMINVFQILAILLKFPYNQLMENNILLTAKKK
jgi:hypothetical protein